jgi:hypothetical protein
VFSREQFRLERHCQELRFEQLQNDCLLDVAPSEKSR